MVVTLSFNTHQLAGRIGGGGATALKHKAPRQHRAVVDTRVSANYWEDVNSIARVLDSPSQVRWRCFFLLLRAQQAAEYTAFPHTCSILACSSLVLGAFVWRGVPRNDTRQCRARAIRTVRTNLS